MPQFQLTSQYQPTGDQPEAIEQLTQGVLEGLPAQTLLGVTGSGKTFTIANVIQNVGKPTLILSHNKTLAAQLYGEMKSFFPNNAVEYYVSYYDYYQPEAYIPSTDTYIEKDLAINDEIDKLRLAATSALLSGRKDVIVVSSVSCIYGRGNPAAFYENVILLHRGQIHLYSQCPFKCGSNRFIAFSFNTSCIPTTSNCSLLIIFAMLLKFFLISSSLCRENLNILNDAIL